MKDIITLEKSIKELISESDLLENKRTKTFREYSNQIYKLECKRKKLVSKVFFKENIDNG